MTKNKACFIEKYFTNTTPDHPRSDLTSKLSSGEAFSFEDLQGEC